jgi:hypothetical protein
MTAFFYVANYINTIAICCVTHLYVQYFYSTTA